MSSTGNCLLFLFDLREEYRYEMFEKPIDAPSGIPSGGLQSIQNLPYLVTLDFVLRDYV